VETECWTTVTRGGQSSRSLGTKM